HAGQTGPSGLAIRAFKHFHGLGPSKESLSGQAVDVAYSYAQNGNFVLGLIGLAWVAGDVDRIVECDQSSVFGRLGHERSRKILVAGTSPVEGPGERLATFNPFLPGKKESGYGSVAFYAAVSREVDLGAGVRRGCAHVAQPVGPLGVSLHSV